GARAGQRFERLALSGISSNRKRTQRTSVEAVVGRDKSEAATRRIDCAAIQPSHLDRALIRLGAVVGKENSCAVEADEGLQLLCQTQSGFVHEQVRGVGQGSHL